MPDTQCERKIQPDFERRTAWHQKHRDLLGQLLVAPDASRKATLDALKYLIAVESMNTRDSARPDREERMARVLQWLERFERETSDKWPLASLYLSVAQALSRMDAERCLAFITQKRTQHTSSDRADVAIREALDGRLRTLLAEAEPLWVRLRALDGRLPTHGSIAARSCSSPSFP